MSGGQKPNVDHQKKELFLQLGSRMLAGECLIWPGTKDRKGYGRVWFGGRWRLAHHVIWEVNRGPLSPGLTLDHFRMNSDRQSCSKACVNLLHLEAVTNVVNVMRSGGACAQHARKTHCKRGHEFTPENIYTKPNGKIGHRECRECKDAAGRARRQGRAA